MTDQNNTATQEQMQDSAKEIVSNAFLAYNYTDGHGEKPTMAELPNLIADDQLAKFTDFAIGKIKAKAQAENLPLTLANFQSLLNAEVVYLIDLHTCPDSNYGKFLVEGYHIDEIDLFATKAECEQFMENNLIDASEVVVEFCSLITE